MFEKHKDLFITLALVLFSAVFLFANLNDIGLCWDESIYLGWSVRYSQWFTLLFKSLFKGGLFELFSERAVNYFWVGANQHPPLVIILGAWSLNLLGEVVGPVISLRLVNLICFSLLIGLTFRFGLLAYNRRVGLFAGLCLLGMPRMFGSGLIYGLDIPLVLIWMLVTFCFVKGLKNKRWALLTGICLGLAFLTKINAVFLPIIFLLWFLTVFILRNILLPECRDKKYDLRQKITAPIFRYNILAMFLVAPLVVFCLWPHLWHHPLSLIKAYVLNKADRMIIPVYYLGKQYTQTLAPWHYPLVLILVTVPLVILILFFIGLICGLKDSRKNAVSLLIILSFGLQLLIISLPGVPKYDGVRLFLNIFPFMALLAGLGADWLWVKFFSRQDTMSVLPIKKIAPGAVVCVFLIIVLFPIYQARPFYLAYYNEIVGGPAGANKSGFETTFWGDTCNEDILDYIKQNSHPDDKICLYPIESSVPQAWKILGDVRADIHIDSDYKSGDYDYLILNCRQGFFDDMLWDIYKNKTPVFGTYYGRLPLTVIYKF